MIYYANTGVLTSRVAGSIHLNKLPMERIPAIKELIAHFENSGGAPANFGAPLFLGKDESGNEVFGLDFAGEPGLGLQTVYFLLTAHSNPLDWKFFNVKVSSHFYTVIGAFVYNKLKLDRLGKHIFAYGIQESYQDIVALVKKAKELSRSFG